MPTITATPKTNPAEKTMARIIILLASSHSYKHAVFGWRNGAMVLTQGSLSVPPYCSASRALNELVGLLSGGGRKNSAINALVRKPKLLGQVLRAQLVTPLNKERTQMDMPRVHFPRPNVQGGWTSRLTFPACYGPRAGLKCGASTFCAHGPT
jgi:hypothetical protein